MKKSIKLIALLGVIIFTIQGCGSNQQFESIKEKIEAQFNLAFKEIAIIQNNQENGNSLVVPRTLSKSGELVLVPSEDWTSGFFPGSLWYMYDNTGDVQWRDKAVEFTEVLEKEQFNTTNHDIGFMMYCSYGNAYRLTNTPAYKDILIQSAKSLITRYDKNVGCIRSWDFGEWEFPVIIDNMMNLELLFWATEATGDSTYYNVAVSHADVTMKNHFRENGSCYHVVDYDTISGASIGKMTFQGYSDESSWARGQAWALYGYTMMYRETGQIKYLEHARKIGDFILTHKNLPKDLVPYWDYDASNIPNEPKDVSAAAVVASALFDLASLDTQNNKKYVDIANKIVRNLSNDYFSKTGSNKGFLLDHSTGFLTWDVEVDVPLNYADYYFMEALTRQLKINHSFTN